MNNEYTINPVKATLQKYGKNYDGIQALNDTCFGICAAFSGTSNTYNMDKFCEKQCSEMIENEKYRLFGVGSCDHQVPYKPVIWEQVPRYVPSLIKKGQDKETARLKCKQLCDINVPLLKAECKDKCDLDANAVQSQSNVKPNSMFLPSLGVMPNLNTFNPLFPKKNVFAFVSILTISLIMVIFLLFQK